MTCLNTLVDMQNANADKCVFKEIVNYNIS